MSSRNSSIRSRLTFTFLLIISIAAQSLFAAGSGIIKAKILDKTTGEPLIGANIIVLNTSIGSSSNTDGISNIYGIPVGQQTIKISYIGYETIIVPLTITENATIEQEFRLSALAIEGEEVVVTAQARGQQAAINQQLASNTISNIVAADRIKELPDVSAAESIGRLPGISIDRYNGEATGVAIRGLAPRYNTVTVNGVVLPSTNSSFDAASSTSSSDRSVDLSLISTNLIDGIEVKKANTADMDADALGGTIDLRLKEAPEEFQINGGLQGGYNNLSEYLGNYNGYLSVSDRFLNNDLGIILGVNLDRNNRTADKLNITYLPGGDETIDKVTINQLTPRREEAFKNRIGANIMIDYKIPSGKMTGNGFYNQAKTDGTYRQDQIDFRENKHYYNLETNISTTSLYTAALGIEQDFEWIKYDLGVSATGSRSEDPNDLQWQFSQEAAAYTGTAPTVGMTLDEVAALITPSDTTTVLQSLNIFNRRLNEKTKTIQFNFQVPYKISDNISGYIKTGAKFRWLEKSFDQENWGKFGLAYGGLWASNGGPDLLRGLSARYPNEWNFDRDSLIFFDYDKLPLFRFYRGYNPPSNFLDGRFKLGKIPDITLMQQVMDVYPEVVQSRNWARFSIGSLGSDYNGKEQYQAAYIMTEINIGPYITFIPGVRYDADYTKYHGQSFKVANSANVESPPIDFQLNENERSNSFWLPQIHLKLHPLEWLRLHFAGTETVTRPDYNMYAPITNVNAYGNYIRAANGALKDSRSRNLDISMSVYENYLGFVTISGFYKKIDNLILYASIKNVSGDVFQVVDSALGVNINAPASWFGTGYAPQIDTWINNPGAAQYRGIEFDWQTNFWYLPSVFKGLVFSLNWTYISSQVDLHQWKVKEDRVYDPINDGWVITHQILHSTVRSRMPGQPAHLFNSTLGYDYSGFSIRVSYLYQSDKFSNLGETPVVNGYTGSYNRWDLAIQQKITSNVQLFLNANNLTNTHDESLLGYRENNPTSLQYYGQTVDLGLRVNF